MMPKTVTNSKRRELARRLQRKPRRLDKLFDCINCSQSKTVRCKLKLDHRVGFLECEKCKVTYSTSIHHLSHDVDVYHAWIDASEELTTRARSTTPSPVQKTKDTPRYQEQRDQQQERRASPHATSSSPTSYKYQQQQKVDRSPQSRQQHISYSPQYQPWDDDDEREDDYSDSRYEAHQVDYGNHRSRNQAEGSGSRGRGAGARRG
ncbi:hypothetical protein BGZ72_003473 [Mortierella alpina]|nr:hypothetical protein BGZ72_003473 [Mortierella alpina]